MANVKRRKKIFCEFAFLKKFRSANAHISPIDNAEALSNWVAVMKYIQKSHLLVDVDKQTFADNVRMGDAIFRLYKQSSQGQFTINYASTQAEKDVDFYIGQPESVTTSYLLTKKSAICQHFRKSYGVNVLSPECWTSNESAKENSFYFRDCGSIIDKRDRLSWSSIFRSEYQLSNCNSMLIVDNYIEKNLERNLLAILDALLPESLYEIEFHLTILTQRNDKRNTESYQEEYDKICKFVKLKRPKLNCQVELYVTTEKSGFHDRSIITNNAKIDSGAGFSLLNGSGNVQNNTQIEIVHPYLQSYSDSCDLAYENSINDIRAKIDEIDDATRRKSGFGMHWPSDRHSINRLLRM